MSLLAQLRIGMLPLQVEVERCYRKPLNERICSFFFDHMIEDKCHFVCMAEQKFLEGIQSKLSIIPCLPPNEESPPMNC